MSAVSALPMDIVAWLGAQEQLSDITFMTEFPPVKKAIPLKKAIVAVGLEEVGITDKFEANDQGVLVENEYCRLADIRISLDIHVPFAFGGERCHDVFTTIIDCLTFASDLDIVKSGCSAMEAERNTDALVLKAWIDVTANFCPAASSDLNFQSFLDKTLLCGSHIRNTDIHVTPEDKARWDQSFTTGNYMGNGATTRTIELDFQPRLVLVFATQYPPVRVDFSASRSYCYWGVATPGYASQGLEISTGGFRLLSSSNYVAGTSYPRLNESGTAYRYLVLP